MKNQHNSIIELPLEKLRSSLDKELVDLIVQVLIGIAEENKLRAIRRKEVHNRGVKAWQKRNKHAVIASGQVHNAIKNGIITKQPCEVCGTSDNVEAHHHGKRKDYLNVIWLCKEHHNIVHNSNRKLKEYYGLHSTSH